MSADQYINIEGPGSDRQIRAALKSVLASDEFVRSERLNTFLSYLVDKTLNNQTERLKGYALGLDVFNRDDNFNPDTDTIVRVHAVRLRAALAKYYLTEGSSDEIEICLPKGGYVPVFEQRTPKPETSEQLSKTTLSPVIYPVGPKVAVLPVEDISPSTEFADQARGLTLQIINDLTRFRNLRIISMSSAMKLKQGNKSEDELFRELGIDYLLTVSLLNNGRVVIVSAQLLSPGDMATLWSDMIERELNPKHVARILQGVSAQIAAVTGSNYGAIAQAEATRISNEPENVSDAYKCFMRFFSYLAQKTTARHADQKKCLEEIVNVHPDTARAWAMLSWIYGDELRFAPHHGTGDKSLQKSLAAARRAVDIDPTDSFTVAHLAQSLALANQTGLASEYFDKALKLNPNDTELLASTALHHANQGDWEMAKMLADRAIELSPKHPNWFRFVPFMTHLRRSEYDQALAQVEALYEEASPFVNIGRMVAYAKLGRIHEAQQLLSELDKEFPDYCKNIVEKFEQRHLPKEIALIIRETIEEIR